VAPIRTKLTQRHPWHPCMLYFGTAVKTNSSTHTHPHTHTPTHGLERGASEALKSVSEMVLALSRFAHCSVGQCLNCSRQRSRWSLATLVTSKRRMTTMLAVRWQKSLRCRRGRRSGRRRKNVHRLNLLIRVDFYPSLRSP